MSKGFWAGEAIATGLELAAAESGRLAAWQTANKLRQQLDELALGNAANLAEKGALRKALARYDPKHPLLTNAHLKERIHRAGERVYLLSESTWTDVLNAGRDFQY